MIKVLQPIHAREKYSEPIEATMLQQLWDTIFKPIFDILNVKTPARVSSLTDLKTALRAGRIFWQDGYFYGSFNSVIGKTLRDMGATFSASKKAYKLDINKLPMDLRTDIVIGKGMNRTKTEAVLKHLESIKPMKLVVGTGMQAATMFDDLNEQTITTFKVLPENIQIPMELPESQRKELLGTYQKNIDLYLNDWKKEQVERLKIKTEKNAALGYRADRLADVVKSEFGVTKTKAKMIARQETALIVSKYREIRYTNAGVGEYIWSCSLDERVRPDHKALHHMKFSWDSPPIVDRATGRRGNPGEDFNCRCVALPVIRMNF